MSERISPLSNTLENQSPKHESVRNRIKFTNIPSGYISVFHATSPEALAIIDSQGLLPKSKQERSTAHSKVMEANAQFDKFRPQWAIDAGLPGKQRIRLSFH